MTENNFTYVPLAEPIPISEQKWPEGTTPLVSTSTLTYNHNLYIRDCLDGILMQKTTFPVRVVIFDDCSTDGTREIVKEYKNKHPNLIVEILPATNTWNKPKERKVALKPYFEARNVAKYIALCEGDDYWTDPLKLQKQVDFLEKNPDCVITGHDANFLNDNNQIIQDSKLSKNYKKDATNSELIQCFSILSLTMVFRNIKELFEDFPKESINVQLKDAFLISMLGNYGYYHYMPEIKPAIYRMHSGGVWSKKTDITKTKMQIKTFLHLEMFYKRIGKKEIQTSFIQKKRERINRYLTLAFEERNKKEFFKAIKMYFKEFKVYKNFKQMVYLSKITIKFLLNKS